MASLDLDIIEEVREHKRHDGSPFKLRYGTNTGSLITGIIGKLKFVYDGWGDSVNVGSRMESEGEPGKTQLTQRRRQLLKNKMMDNSSSQKGED